MQMNEESDWDKFLFRVVYLLAGAVAAYHSAIVFMVSDPWYVAIPAAIVVDGLTAYSVNMLGKWKNNQRTAGFIGVGLFVIVSASAQIIARYQGAGAVVPPLLAWVSLALVPLSSTGAVVALGLVKFFGSRKHKTDENVTTSVTIVPELKQPEIISDFVKEPERQSTALLPASAGMVKRGPGRPKKIEQVAYAKDADSASLK